MSILATPPELGSDLKGKNPSWQAELCQAIRDPAQLCELLELPADVLASAQAALAAKPAGDFPLFVPRPFLARMKTGDPRDPLLLQVLPVAAETATPPGFSDDPVGDGPASPRPGLVHKYQGRALLITTGACAVHCRYCFRRHFPYGEAPHSLADWEPVLAEVAADDSLEEIILSGGDPLMLVDGFLASLVRRLAAIPHLRRLRIHTRLPIMIPQRITPELLAWLTGTRLSPVMVIHANHPAELGDDVGHALARLAMAGVPLLNQSVLLAGVNDSADVLAELSQRLIDQRVMPYYLHRLDRVAGAAHFEVPTERGRQLIAELREGLPGYAVPRFVEEIPGQPHKTVLA